MDRCFIVLQGVLIEEETFGHDARQIVQMHVPGDVCGLSALSGGTTNAGFVALSPVSYLSVDSDWLRSLTRECPDICRAVWREMSREAAISAAWTTNNSQRPAYQRLAHFFCELEARSRPPGRATSNVTFETFGRQSDLSAATGLSLVHTNKTLRKLESDGLLSYGRCVEIRDLAKLAAVAGFDPAYLTLDRESLGNMLLARINALVAAEPADIDAMMAHALAGAPAASQSMAN